MQVQGRPSVAMLLEPGATRRGMVKPALSGRKLTGAIVAAQQHAPAGGEQRLERRPGRPEVGAGQTRRAPSIAPETGRQRRCARHRRARSCPFARRPARISASIRRSTAGARLGPAERAPRAADVLPDVAKGRANSRSASAIPSRRRCRPVARAAAHGDDQVGPQLHHRKQAAVIARIEPRLAARAASPPPAGRDG